MSAGSGQADPRGGRAAEAARAAAAPRGGGPLFRRVDSGLAWASTGSHGSCRSISCAAERQAEMERRLLAGLSARRSLRCWVSGSLILTGLGCGVAVQAGYYFLADDCTDDCRQRSCVEDGCVWWGVSVCLIALAVAPLRDDVSLARVTIVASMCVIVTEACFVAGSRYYLLDLPWLGLHQERLGYITLDAVFLCTSVFAITRKGAAQVLSVMWRSLQTYYGAMAVLEVWFFFNGVGCSLEYLLVATMFFILTIWPGFRNAVHDFLIYVFQRKQGKVAAASIAGLLGDCTMTEVVNQATQRFRTIQPSQLTQNDLATSSPDPALYLRSQPTRLGMCDAFVSHSWSDDGEAKWQALQQWCDSFSSRHGREPSLWLDKCCIDQSDIATDLRCLPVFLSGCKEMVVLCGPSYFSRLWCIVEVFTYHHIGSGNAGLSVLPVLREGHYAADYAALGSAISTFDVQRCECSDSADRETIVEIIMACFGSNASFNEMVRRVLVSTLLTPEFPHDWGSDISSSTSESSGSAVSNCAGFALVCSSDSES